MITVLTYILYFFFYSAVGWFFESCYCSIGERKVINRGFLSGPMCPIYGTGTLVMEILLYVPFKDKPILVFFLGMIFCDIVEYLTSFIMEKLFNARWWNYKDELFNLHGRICFKHTLFWGAGAVIFVRFVHPNVERLFARIPDKTIIILVSSVFFVFIVDVIFSVIKASDIRRLKQKLNEFSEFISANASDAKKTLNKTYESIKFALDEAYDKISDEYDKFNRTLDKGNKKINEFRDDIIIEAQMRIQRFEDRIKHYGKNDEKRSKRRNLREIYKSKGKLKASAKKLSGEIMKMIDDVKGALTNSEKGNKD